MTEFFAWFMDLANSKITALLIFLGTFIGILFYVYGSKSRGERLETYRNIPFLDDDEQAESQQPSTSKKDEK